MKIIFATHNKHKAKEIQKILPHNIEIQTLDDIGMHEEIHETGSTLRENAKQKARFVYAKTDLPVFADDTGLEVDALNGAPGVYSARFAGEPKNDSANLELLLRKMEHKENRVAQFCTVICFINNEEERFFEGIAKGSIISEKKGTEGFGYDPVFVPDGYDVSFAQMPINQKNKLSHRAQAFQKFLQFLTEKSPM